MTRVTFDQSGSCGSGRQMAIHPSEYLLAIAMDWDEEAASTNECRRACAAVVYGRANVIDRTSIIEL